MNLPFLSKLNSTICKPIMLSALISQSFTDRNIKLEDKNEK